MAAGNAARDRRIAQLYRDKRLSSYQIADRIGVSRVVVSRVVKRLGLTRPFGWHCKPNPALKGRNDRIERLYRQGLTVQQVIDRMGLDLTKSPVLEVLRARAVPRRQAGSWNPNRPPPSYYRTKEYAARIAPRLGTGPGTSAAAFAKAAGIKVDTLRAHLRRQGVVPRRGMGMARLTAATVKRIKRMLVRSKRTFTSIADRFDITDSTVNSIAMDKTWKHVPWPGGKAYQRRRPQRLPRPLAKGPPRRLRLGRSRAGKTERERTHHLRIGTWVVLRKDAGMEGRVVEVIDSDPDTRPMAPWFKIKWKSGLATWHRPRDLVRRTI